jgi:hypothetical protein
MHMYSDAASRLALCACVRACLDVGVCAGCTSSFLATMPREIYVLYHHLYDMYLILCYYSMRLRRAYSDKYMRTSTPISRVSHAARTFFPSPSGSLGYVEKFHALEGLLRRNADRQSFDRRYGTIYAVPLQHGSSWAVSQTSTRESS